MSRSVSDGGKMSTVRYEILTPLASSERRMMTGPMTAGGDARTTPDLAEGEALTAFVEDDAVLADLFHLRSAVDRLPLAIAPAVDEDEALGGDLGVRQDFQLELRRSEEHTSEL